jgi:hypothetical protein
VKNLPTKKLFEHYYDAGWLVEASLASSIDAKSIESEKVFFCALLSYSLLILMDQKNVAYYVWHFMKCVCCHDFFIMTFFYYPCRKKISHKL